MSPKQSEGHGEKVAASRLSRREFLKTAAAGSGLSFGPLTALSFGGQKRKDSRPLRWKIHEVAKIPHGYQVAVGDVNGDGKPDILALSSEEPLVMWYENPTWKARPVTTQTKHNISLAPRFRPNDPARGMVIAADFSFGDSTVGGSLWWAEPPATLEGEWRVNPIGQLPTSHRLRWADLDGDGRLELVNAPIFGSGSHAPDFSVGAPLTWYAVPEPLLRGHTSAGDTPRGAWESHLIDNTLPVIHGLRIIDWDGDGRDEILTASAGGVHLFHSTGKGSDLRWTRTRLASGEQPGRIFPGEGDSKELHRGSSEIGVGKVNGKRFLATIEPWHGEHVAIYFEPPSGKAGELWEPHLIDSSLHDGHALACADFDGDGNDEIVAGFRGPGTSLHIYSAADSSGLKWERKTLDTEMAAAGIAIEDMNGDGRPDVVTIGASTGNVKWYENLG